MKRLRRLNFWNYVFFQYIFFKNDRNKENAILKTKSTFSAHVEKITSRKFLLANLLFNCGTASIYKVHTFIVNNSRI